MGAEAAVFGQACPVAEVIGVEALRGWAEEGSSGGLNLKYADTAGLVRRSPYRTWVGKGAEHATCQRSGGRSARRLRTVGLGNCPSRQMAIVRFQEALAVAVGQGSCRPGDRTGRTRSC